MTENPILKIGPPVHYVEIDGDALYLGRDCHLAAFIPSLLSKVVSNRHCALRREGEERWMLEDLGSTNGTWMRGVRLFGKALVHTADVFTLGKQGPIVECWKGFGGTGPDATVPESELAQLRGVLTLPDRRSASTIVAGRDGSAEKPYKVGKTPEAVLRHQRTGQEYRVKGYTLVLGRDAEAAQVLIRSDEEKHVSGRHAEIQFRSDHRVVIRDLESRNGTWVNDRRIGAEFPLAEGDRIVLGKAATTLLVVRLSV
jgi:pSer/pThr/pTyr-binding forkhead associated (FHA) protein